MMSEQTKKQCVPVLRFLEFRDAGEWEDEFLGKVGQIITGKTPNTSDETLWNGDIQFVTPTDITDEKYQWNTQRSIVNNPGIKVIPYGSTMFTCIASIGKMSLSVLPCITNQQINTVIPHRDYEKEFIYYSLLSIVPQIKATQANTTLPIINKTDFSKFRIAIPCAKEQQKIAACLSSLDELITAQAQKVEALKAHKKGLMQQLFPAEGETVPKLRFPEFRDAGKWEEINLGSIGKVSMCKRILKDETRPYGDIPFYKIGTFGKQADAYISREVYESYKSKYSYPKKGDILISASGTIGRLVVFDGSAAYFQDSNIVWIDNNESLVKNAFLFYCYKNIKWATDNNIIARLYNDNLSGMKIFITSIPEQQKIAACLSSLDDLITTQTQKLVALKTHKKGLMQQLFPSAHTETTP